MSYNPDTKLAYIPAMHAPGYFESAKSFQYDRDDNTAVISGPQDKPLPKTKVPVPKEESYLLAWDPVRQKEVWRVKSTLLDFNGGVLSTSGGLVFEGTADGFFYVYDATTGERLKTIEIGTGIMAAPVTYEIDGEQYVAVMAGLGGVLVLFVPKGAAVEKYQNKGRILVFKLGGRETPLPPKQEIVAVPKPPEKQLSDEGIAKGKILYTRYCKLCHSGFGKNHGSQFPDLGKMSEAAHDQFNKIVLDGALSAYGMAGFSDILKKEDAEAIHDFIISNQRKIYKSPSEL